MLKEYLAWQQERLHLMAGLDWELMGEISSKQLSGLVKTRKSRTRIMEVKLAGAVVSDSREVLAAASNFFRDIFGRDRRADFEGWSPIPERSLREEDAAGLDADWSEEEVKAAFAALAKNKSPGSDGLPKEFFEVNWDLLGRSFMALVRDFTATGAVPGKVKEVVTILLHKKGDKDQLSNYRPITLLSFAYKILAKVIADRVKKVLHRVISPEQYGFIPGRRLTDGVALVADIIDAAKNGEEDWYLLLVDFQKAFDSVSRDFVFHVLHRMGFPPRMVTWIRGLHAGTTTKMLVNGWLGAGIEVVSGVRQECPLAPYLFLCAVEPLVQMVESKRLGLDVAGQRLSYMGYADDTTLALQGKEQLAEAESILDTFEKQSGLATNKAKSTILPLRADLGRDDGGAFKWAKPKDAERRLGVWVTPDGSGLPTWEKALEEIKRRLALWKQKYLTEKARGAVANGYIQPVMTFQAQVYPPPASVWKEIEKLLHNFVSGNKATPDKVFLLWSTELLYTLRHEGGLGVQDPNITLSCLAARRVGLMMTEVNQLKKELMMRAADLPLKLDTFTAHERLLRHWEGRSQRWKQTCELFMKSPLSIRTVGVTEAEVAKERIVFNRAIMVGVTSPMGGQKDAENLWDWVLGDLVRRQRDGTAMLKTMAELTEELGGKGPAKLVLIDFVAAPAEWREALLTPCSSSADRGLAGATSLPRVPILEGGEVISLKQMRRHWSGKRGMSQRMMR
ncbi:unnamed protein product [Closterium sp. Yama58-4]|nr:unnamed protein product [Closterium sp. Yama58-4]